MEVTEAIRDQIDELRRDKAMRFDSLILELQTEIRAKNSQMKDTWRQFEEAVVGYEKISSISADIPESVEEESDHEDMQEDAPSPQVASEHKQNDSDIDDDDDFYDKTGLSLTELDDNGFVCQSRPSEGDGYNKYMDKSLIEGEDNQSTIPLVGTPVAAVVIPDRSPARRSHGRNSIGSAASSKLHSNDSPKRKAQAKCKRLQNILKALEASISESQFKLVFTREDYQRSLQALDDLEDELCSISTRFELDEKKSLGHFFSALQTKQDQPIVEVYKDLKEYKTKSTDFSHRGIKRKRDFDQSQAGTVGPSQDHHRQLASKEVHTDRGGKPVLKTLFAMASVAALAAATGMATGYIPTSF